MGTPPRRSGIDTKIDVVESQNAGKDLHRPDLDGAALDRGRGVLSPRRFAVRGARVTHACIVPQSPAVRILRARAGLLVRAQRRATARSLLLPERHRGRLRMVRTRTCGRSGARSNGRSLLRSRAQDLAAHPGEAEIGMVVTRPNVSAARPWLARPPFVCPRCHAGLDATNERYRCASCAADYPVVLGIPDFRIFPDPWIGLEDDRNKARRLARLVENQPFADAVRTYWELTPDTPRPLAARFTSSVLEAEARASEWLEWLERAEGQAPAGPWLDIGCGTGGLLAAAAARGIGMMGVDVALRWLVVAGRRDGLSERTDSLVCANGEHLPFAPGTFGRVLSVSTLEHCRDAERLVADARRVLRRGGVLCVKTVNRYS